MKKYLELFKQTFREFVEDKAPRLGAALAYYTIFAIAPLLLIAISIAGLVFGQEAAMGQISTQIKGVVGDSTAKALEEMIENAAKPTQGKISAAIGVVMLLFGAAGVFGQLKEALNTIWEIAPKKAGGVMGIIKERFLSMVMVMGVGFLLLVTLVFDAVAAAMGNYIGTRFPGGEALLQIVQLVISFALVTVVFAMIFRYVPDIRIPWRDVWHGAVLTSILFVLGKFGLGLYLGKAAVGSAYGAAGSLIVLLVWVYWSAQIVFFGAEFTQVYARSHGSMKDRATTKPIEVEDRRPRLSGQAGRLSSTTVKSGGKGKLVAGGVAGLIVGVILSGVTAVIVLIKSVKRLLMIPFK